VSPVTTQSALDSRMENGRGLTKKPYTGGKEMEFRVKDLSRLWLYRNGESPKVDDVDVGIARMATV